MFFKLVGNGLGYELLRGLALNFASTHQTENLRGFSEVGEYKQPARPACRAGYL